ncbi:MAG: PspA-associated protein PspAA [Methermicoccaceae archaeon]
MIVRLMGEGQYVLSDADMDVLNRIDNEIVAAIEREDEQAFERGLAQLVAEVKQRGTPLSPDVLKPSEVVVPPADLSFEEARKIFTGEGIIPD